MTRHEVSPADRQAIADSIVPPPDPYAGYDARQAELGEKDHPWAQPVREAEPVQELVVDEATLAREAFHVYAVDAFRLNPRGPRTEAERQAQIATDSRGRAAAEAELAKMRARRGEK